MQDRKKIEEVFTPREANVNPAMYISREKYETEFLRRIRGSMHVVLPGDSGIGKSWLYKKVLKDNDVPFYIANCGSTTSKRTLTNVIVNTLLSSDTQRVDRVVQTKSTELNAGIGKIKSDSTDQWVAATDDHLKEAYERLVERHQGKRVIVVFDNLEAIFESAEAMKELSNILLLVDDPSFSVVKFLLVGTPQNMLEYFRKLPNLASVANRITELDRIPLLSDKGVERFCRAGFVEELEFSISDEHQKAIYDHVYSSTIGIPQYMHEYCEFLAYEIVDNASRFEKVLIANATQKWLLSNLRQYYVELERLTNKKDSKIGRRNQILFCIGKLRVYSFSVSDIEKKILEHFPTTGDIESINIPAIMASVGKGNQNLIKKFDGQNKWEIVDPKFVMTIRMALFKNSEEKVLLNHFRMQ